MRVVLPTFLMVAALLFASAGAQETFKKDTKNPKDEKKDSHSVYEIGGKTFDVWLKELHSLDPSRREAAMRTVIMFESEKASKALKPILEELQRHTKERPIDLSVRVSGILALTAILGSQKDPDKKTVEATIRVLRVFLRDEQAIVKYRALQALPLLGREGRVLIPNVIPLVKDFDTWETRQAAIQTLMVLAADPKVPASPEVLKAFEDAAARDASNQVRFSSLQALAALGAGVTPVQKAQLITVLDGVAAKDVDPSVKLWAHMALMTVHQKIGPENLAPIAKLLSNGESPVRIQAAQALGMCGKGAKDFSKSLIGGLGDPEPTVIAACMIALVQIEAKNAVPALQKMSDDPNQHKDLKKAAVEAIDQIQNPRKFEAKKMEEDEKKKMEEDEKKKK